MASLLFDVRLAVPVAAAWDAVRDVGALHERLAVGFVTDVVLDPDGGARTVTFANGLVVRERFVTLDDEHHRLVYTNDIPGVEHHSAAVRVHAVPGDAGACRLEWITDVLPDTFAEPVGAMMREGMAALQRTLEGAVARG